jgi:membrane-associated PAP2 superfamily phosphatase
MNPQRRSDAVVAALGLLVLLAWDASGLDLAAVRSFGTGQGFAWRDHWLVGHVLHTGGRWLALCVLAGLVLNALWPGGLFATQLTKRQRVWWPLATLACAVLVPGIKQLTQTSCPWDLQEFGGMAQYVHHWRLGVRDGGGGHCFPSGHAASAFALLSGWFVLRGTDPRAARLWLAAVLVAGVTFGTAQMMRGAHYPSHTLWTAWFCWVICALAAPALRSAPAR